MRIAIVALVLATSVATAVASDPPKVDRKIVKEPAYAGKPAYAMLVFGAEGKDRVWIVRDGDTLYVDKNGNGDLTEASEKISKQKPKKGREEDKSVTFDVGEIKLGGRVHKGLTLYASPLSTYEGSSIAKLPPVAAVLEKNKETPVYTVKCEVETPGLKGGGTDGRLYFMAGFLDLNGVLQFAEKPEDAPVIHFGGPLEISFYAELPKMRVGRSTQFDLVVGTPGIGAGTFAMLTYDDTIPKDAYPKAEITFSPKKPGEAPFKENFELKERC